MIGKTLSHYKILEKLGAGGQGEVYLAEDSRLDRKVALKILPQHLSERADLRERFEREARAVSSLNHPHICTLYDIGEQDGIHYLVMEHLVGETLEARLAKGPLPLEQTLECAIQIADALDKAHRQGVVHRDLKPGNIMLVKSGAKLLDFGLAKLQAADTPTNLSALPTEQANLTAEGTILGTLQYMAPEQLEGKEADSRTDIFAFGAVVYEMATGKKAFEGKSQASLIAAILKDDPPAMAALQPMTPTTLDHVVRRCMSKAPEDRWQAASDVMAELKWVGEAGSQPDVSAPVISRSRNRERLAWGLAVAVLVLVSVGLGLLALQLSVPLSPTTTRLAVTLPQESPVARPEKSPYLGVAISPDGRRIVYRGEDPSGTDQLYVRSLERVGIESLPGTENAFQPFFSPDGQWVAFFTTAGDLKKIRIDGGSPVPLLKGLPNSSWSFGDWLDDDTIIFGAVNRPLQQVSAEGGNVTALTEFVSEDVHGHLFPKVVSDTGDILFSVWHTDDTWHVHLVEPVSGERKMVVENARAYSVTGSGHLLFIRDDILMAASFDSAAGQIVGPAVPVPESIVRDLNRNVPQLAVSATGTLAYLPALSARAEPTLGWASRKGEFTPLGPLPVDSRVVDLSPDGNTALVHAGGISEREIFLFDMVRRVTTRLNIEKPRITSARWHPDGRHITLGGTSMSLLNLDTGTDTILVGTASSRGASWAPDGKTLAYTDLIPQEDILMLEGEGAEPRPLFATEASEFSPAISPNGRMIAYVSDEPGPREVFLARFPEGTGQTQISRGGGGSPVWSSTGQELFFSEMNDATRKLKAVSVTLGDRIEVGPTQTLFTMSSPSALEEFKQGSNSGASYDVSSDGSQFLMIRRLIPPPQTEITVILNWFEELKRLVPTDN